MNQTTTDLRAKMLPVAALIAYKNEGEGRKDYFLEARRIDSEGRMAEAVPVTYDLMNEIASNYSEVHSRTPHGPIPETLLYADTRRGIEKYVWYNPPRRRVMYFASNLGIGNGEYNMPGIIYVAENGRLAVFAYKDKRPKPDSELFAGPFFNVAAGCGSVCLGSAKLAEPENPCYGDILEYWEKKFWLTEFSHLGGAGNPTAHNLVLITKKAREEPFPLKELRSVHKKLKDLLK